MDTVVLKFGGSSLANNERLMMVANKIKKKITYQELKAPIKKGTAVGFITYSYQGKTLGKVPLLAMQDIKKAGYTDYLLMALDRLLMAG